MWYNWGQFEGRSVWWFQREPELVIDFPVRRRVSKFSRFAGVYSVEFFCSLCLSSSPPFALFFPFCFYLLPSVLVTFPSHSCFHAQHTLALLRTPQAWPKMLLDVPMGSRVTRSLMNLFRHAPFQTVLMALNSDRTLCEQLKKIHSESSLPLSPFPLFFSLSFSHYRWCSAISAVSCHCYHPGDKTQSVLPGRAAERTQNGL